MEIELFRIPYPPKPVQPATNATNINNSHASGVHNLSHDRNGAKGNRILNQADLQNDAQSKRQTRSSKRHVVSH